MLKVGDKVRIRHWDEMIARGAKEMSFDEGSEYDYLNTPAGFMRSMAELCGKHATIITVEEGEGGVSYYNLESDEDGDFNWEFDDSMLEKINE